MSDSSVTRRVRGAASTDKVRFAKELRQAATPTEGLLWERLRGRALGAKFRRQHPVGDFVLDFYCEEARLGVEIDGSVHEGREDHDTWRDEQLGRLGIRMLHITPGEIETDIVKVLSRIRDALRAEG